MPKISIVIPCYNVEKYLKQCLDSLVGQTYRDIEIIAMDDGSPDNSGAICDEYAARDSRVRVIHKENGGVSAARNDGLAAASGEYVLFCDGDDWMPPDACAHLAAAAEATAADVIFGDIWRSWDDRNEYMRFFAEPFCTEEPAFIRELVKTNFYYTYCPAVPERDRADGCYGGPWNKAVRRSLLLERGIRFDVRVRGIYDDVLYSAHVLANAKRIAYTGKPVYHYRQVQQSITHVFKKNILQINEAIFASWEEFLDQYDPSGDFVTAYHANVIRRLDHALQVYFFSESNPASRKDRLGELKALLRTEPYRTAVKAPDPDRLNKRHRMEALLAKHRCAAGLWALYALVLWRKRRKKS